MLFFRAAADDVAQAQAWETYGEHLERIRESIPVEVYAFASASWHYSLTDHRSLHDSWVESVAIQESNAASDVAGERVVTIRVRLLGPYHDGHTELTYSDVTGYTLGLGRAADDLAHLAPSQPVRVGHGDWLVDEIRIGQGGGIIHEVLFTSGRTWVIEAGTVTHWTDIPPTEG